MSKASGKIITINDVQEFASGSKKLTFVIELNETDYNGNKKILSFDYFAGKTKLEKIENFMKYNHIGNTVDVDYDIDCREYAGKYYTNLSAWKVFGTSSGSSGSSAYNPDSPDPEDEIALDPEPPF